MEFHRCTGKGGEREGWERGGRERGRKGWEREVGEGEGQENDKN